MKLKKLLKDTITIVSITLLFLVLIEISLRLIFPDKRDKREPETYAIEKKILYKEHPFYLYSLKPNIKGTFVRSFQNGGDTITWKTNSDGFRGKELRKNPRKRIMVYGDSNIQAEFSKEENTFVSKLEENLMYYYKKDIEVVNAGVIGYGPDQALLRMKEEAPLYNPDMIIFHVFADNDFGDVLRNNILRLDVRGKLTLQNNFEKDFLTIRKKSVFQELLLYRAAKKISRFLYDKDNEDLDNLIVSSYIKRCNQEYSSYIANISNMNLFEDHYDITTAITPNSESSRLKKKLIELILLDAINYTKSRNIRLIVLIQPSVIDVCKNYSNVNYEILRQKFPEYNQSNLSTIVENICNKNNIININLYKPFIENSPENLYFVGEDNHWNDLGQKLASEITANYIINNQLLNE